MSDPLNKRSKPALFIACENGQSSIVDMLLQRDYNVDPYVKFWGTYVQAAAWGGSSKAFHSLLAHEAPLEGRAGVYGKTLEAAKSGGNADIVCTTLEAGAEIGAVPLRRVNIWKPYLPKKKIAIGVSIYRTKGEEMLKRLFPNADMTLLHLLASAYARRRQLRRYWERHEEELWKTGRMPYHFSGDVTLTSDREQDLGKETDKTTKATHRLGDVHTLSTDPQSNKRIAGMPSYSSIG